MTTNHRKPWWISTADAVLVLMIVGFTALLVRSCT